MFRFRSRFGGCLRRFAGFGTLRGAAGGYFPRPLSGDFVGMSQPGTALATGGNRGGRTRWRIRY
eukprot:3870073-Pyramimonas_sp.AAC.1